VRGGLACLARTWQFCSSCWPWLRWCRNGRYGWLERAGCDGEAAEHRGGPVGGGACPACWCSAVFGLAVGGRPTPGGRHGVGPAGVGAVAGCRHGRAGESAGAGRLCGPAWQAGQCWRAVYDTDPAIRWEHGTSGWGPRDTETGILHRSGLGDPASPHDVAYLGRLPRPDGNGAILALAGIHPQGSLGVARLLATDISVLWGQAADGRFSAIVGTDYDPATHEPVQTELLSPLYRHHQD